MKFKFKLGFKLSAVISAILAVSILLVSLFIYFSVNNMVKDLAVDEVEAIAREHAMEIDAELETGMNSIRAIASIFKGYRDLNIDERRSDYSKMLFRVLNDNDSILAVWTVWEKNALDGLDDVLARGGKGAHNNDAGRFTDTYFRKGGRIVMEPSSEADTLSGDYYNIPKKNGRETMLDPYWYTYTGNSADNILMTSLAVPILENGRHIAMVGLDLDIGIYQNTILKVRDQLTNKFGAGYAFLFSYSGIISAHPNNDKFLMTNVIVTLDENERTAFSNDMVKGEAFFRFKVSPATGITSLYYYAPIYVGHAKEPWYLAVVMPLNAVMARSTMILFTALGIALIFIILGAVGVLLYSRTITRPIGLIRDGMLALSKGDIALKTFLEKHKAEDIAKIDARGDELTDISGSMHALIGYVSEKEQIAKSLADGDFTVTPSIASDHDAFGMAYQGMVTGLSGLLSEIRAMIEQIESGAAQVSTASQSLSQGASEQASSLEEVTSSLTEITSQTRHNADNAQQAQTLAKGARDSADKGNTQVLDLAKAMNAINNSAANIKKIVKTIDEIAFQTNLLALNANVEAARAGKYGKGFAVVAEEVRSLAVKSAVSVKETTEMVEGVVRDIASGVSLTESSAAQFAEILAGATRVADLSAEVAAASGEMAKGLSQVDTGLSQISQVTQANTASAEETASASEELSGQAVNLKQLIARFKLRENAAPKPAAKTEVLPARTVKPEPSKLALHPGKPSQARASDKAVVIPKDVIKLDDDDFGKF